MFVFASGYDTLEEQESDIITYTRPVPRCSQQFLKQKCILIEWMAILDISDSFDTVFLRKYIISISSVSMAGRPAAATFIVPQKTVLAALAMGMEELGPVQLRLMLDED